MAYEYNFWSKYDLLGYQPTTHIFVEITIHLCKAMSIICVGNLTHIMRLYHTIGQYIDGSAQYYVYV